MATIQAKVERVLKKLLIEDLIYSYHIKTVDTHIFELIINDDSIQLSYTYMGLSHLTYDELLKIITFDIKKEIEFNIINDVNDILKN
jgi:predicted SAM-dependent methyltransferase